MPIAYTPRLPGCRLCESLLPVNTGCCPTTNSACPRSLRKLFMRTVCPGHYISRSAAAAAWKKCGNFRCFGAARKIYENCHGLAPTRSPLRLPVIPSDSFFFLFTFPANCFEASWWQLLLPLLPANCRPLFGPAICIPSIAMSSSCQIVNANALPRPRPCRTDILSIGVEFQLSFAGRASEVYKLHLTDIGSNWGRSGVLFFSVFWIFSTPDSPNRIYQPPTSTPECPNYDNSSSSCGVDSSESRTPRSHIK